ncbi:flippase [Paraburkholderia denitrificans]|uniref:Flippase n=1 Tax=Paraburkholderia denitrificans TaxID=694025 RepID=A0ABW0JAR8_9BURK
MGIRTERPRQVCSNAVPVCIRGSARRTRRGCIASHPSFVRHEVPLSARKDAIALYVIQGCNFLVPLLALPWLSRTLGPEKFGQLGFAQAFIQFFIMMTDFGFDLTAARKVSINRDNPVELARLYWTVTIAKGGLAALSILVVVVMLLCVPSLYPDRWVIAIGFLSVVGTVLNPLWLYQGLERMPRMALVSLLSRVACLVPFFLFVRSPQDYLIAAATIFLPLMLSGLWLTGAAHVNGMVTSWQRVTWADLREQSADAFQIFSGSALTFLYTYANTVVLRFIGGNVQVGYYVTADKLTSPIRQLLWPLVQTLFPRVCKLYAQGDTAAAEEIVRKLISAVVLVNALAILTIYLVGDRLVLLLFGARFMPALPVLKVLIFLPFILALAIILLQLRLVARGELRSLKRIYAIGAGFHAIQLIWLVTWLGALGTAIAVVSTETLVTGLVYYECRKLRHRGRAVEPSLRIGDGPA